MFGPPGRLYVYFSYGVHWCMNVVCGPGAQPHAVLLRAATPLTGIECMYERRRKAKREADLASGPGKLGQAFGMDKSGDGTSLLRGGPLRILDDGVPAPDEPRITPRIGLAPGKGDELLLRFLA
jgi:DNA-3-methyladenine glycosylase